MSLASCGLEDSLANPGLRANGSMSLDVTSFYAPPQQSKAHTSPRRSPAKTRLDRFIPTKANKSASFPAVGGRILEYCPSAPPAVSAADLRSQVLGLNAFSDGVTSAAKTSSIGSLRSSQQAQPNRRISSVPEIILDAPGIVDDYYLNVVDWSAMNKVAIALGQSVYMWDSLTGDVTQVAELGNNTLATSVKWSEDGYLAIGKSNGNIEIWDVEASEKLRTMRGRTARVASLTWNHATLSSGARDGGIWNHDVRIAEHKTAEMWAHSGEVCGLTWRGDGQQLASGGNDNAVHVWDARTTSTPRLSRQTHTAAVKALSWCPWQSSVLATGGGSLDRRINIWNTTTGARVASADTGSQVTSLNWNSNHRELASCHGYPANSVAVWSYPTMTKIAEFEAHETRVLAASLSPDAQTLVTCAADENLKFWKLWDPPPVARQKPSMTLR